MPEQIKTTLRKWFQNRKQENKEKQRRRNNAETKQTKKRKGEIKSKANRQKYRPPDIQVRAKEYAKHKFTKKYEGTDGQSERDGKYIRQALIFPLFHLYFFTLIKMITCIFLQVKNMIFFFFFLSNSLNALQTAHVFWLCRRFLLILICELWMFDLVMVFTTKGAQANIQA